jgi:hypothetical protein
VYRWATESGDAAKIIFQSAEPATDVSVSRSTASGASSAMRDLVGVHTRPDVPDQPPNSLAHVRAASIKCIRAVSSQWCGSRLRAEHPYLDEARSRDSTSSVRSGMWAPKGTPPAVIPANAAIVDALPNPQYNGTARVNCGGPGGSCARDSRLPVGPCRPPPPPPNPPPPPPPPPPPSPPPPPPPPHPPPPHTPPPKPLSSARSNGGSRSSRQ